MYHIRISGTEPSSVILSETQYMVVKQCWKVMQGYVRSHLV